MTNHYPSVGELLTNAMVEIPQALKEQVAIRYVKGRDNYITSAMTEDGRVVNACMVSDNFSEALDEVTDAVFNLLVAMLRAHNSNSTDIPYEKSKVYMLLQETVWLWEKIAKVAQAVQ